MTRLAGRRHVVFALAALGCTRIAAQAAGADRVGGQDDPGLRRLEAVLEKQLARGKDALPLPWQETILRPETARFVWRAHSLAAPNGVERFRVAIDPPTRWYYIGQVGRPGVPLTLYGPLDESTRGTFIDALAAAPAVPDAMPTPAPATPDAKSKRDRKPVSKPKPNPKPETRSKPTQKPQPKPKSSTKVKG